MKPSKLKQHEKLVTARPLDQHVVSQYRHAMREGAKFPPILVTKGRNPFVVDGNLRIAAWTAEFGDADIETVSVKASTNAEIIQEAVKANRAHGMRISGLARRTYANFLVQEGVSSEELATLFQVSIESIQQWSDLTVTVIGNPNPQPRKFGPDLAPLAQVTQKAYTHHVKHDMGRNAAVMAKQLTRWAQDGWIDFSNENTHAVFSELYSELGRHLSSLASQ